LHKPIFWGKGQYVKNSTHATEPQFIESENKRFKTFQLLDTRLKKGGIFFIQSPTQYEHKYNFDLDKEILSNQFFRKYKVITASSLNGGKYSKQTADKLNTMSLKKQ
jgi:hypothetical protein